MAVASLFYFLLFTLSLLTLVDASPSRWSPAIIRRATPPSAANSLHVSAPECDAAKYGGNLRMTGVMNALEKIPQDQSPVTFEMRSATEEPGWFVQLPHRVMSDDAKEFIDIRTRDNVGGDDNASWRAIREVAARIAASCFERAQSVGRGGIVTDVGVQGDLTVAISSYDNSNIRCVRPDAPIPIPFDPSRYESCNEVLGHVRWDKRRLIFTGGALPVPGGAHIKLPAMRTSSDQKCSLVIRMSDHRYRGQEFSSWAEIWAAARAALEGCVRHGRVGGAIKLGMSQKITIQFARLIPTTETSNLTSGSGSNGIAVA